MKWTSIRVTSAIEGFAWLRSCFGQRNGCGALAVPRTRKDRAHGSTDEKAAAGERARTHGIAQMGEPARPLAGAGAHQYRHHAAQRLARDAHPRAAHDADKSAV